MTDGELAVHWAGPDGAPVLLLLHGLTDSGLCWPDAVRRWSGSYRIAAVDALGHGESRRFQARELQVAPVAAMLEQTQALARDLARDRQVVAIGHSMGGGIAAALAAEPELLAAVVLEDPAWLDADEHDPRADADEWLATKAEFDRDPEAALAAGRIANPAWPEPEFPPWALAKVQTDPAFLAVGEAALPQWWEDIVDRIAVPALVVTGTTDVILNQQKLQRIELIGNARVDTRVIRGAGHCVRRDRANEFHQIVDPWLTGVLREQLR